MEKLVNPQKTIEVIQKNEFAFQKRFGQNFLVDARVLDKIIQSAGVTKEDCVLEVGPGIGTMTQALSYPASAGDAEGMPECKGHSRRYSEDRRKSNCGRVQRRLPAACDSEPALLHHHADHHGTL